MSVDTSWSLAALLALATVSITAIATHHAPRFGTTLKMWLFGIIFFAYSGFGLASAERGTSYVAPYVAYLVAFFLGLRLFAGRRPPTDGETHLDRAPWWPRPLATALAYAYVLAILGQIAATGALGMLLHPETVFLGANQGVDIFTGRVQRSANAAYSVLAYGKLLCTPFFYIELQRRLDRRWGSQLVVLLLITYLQVTADQQWGRAALVKPVLIWLFILVVRRRVSVRRFTLVLLTAALLLVPAFNAIADWRTGTSTAAGGLTDNWNNFQAQEFIYPHNYPIAEAMHSGGAYASKFISWLLTLPIPRSLTGTSFSVTRDFSEHILGIDYGVDGFYVLLPSWLGEGIIAFGTGLSWVWAFVVGSIVGAIDRFLAQDRRLASFDAYITTLFAIFLRSVSQEFIGQVVNSLWILLVLYVVHRLTIHPPRPAEQGSRRGDMRRAALTGSTS